MPTRYLVLIFVPLAVAAYALLSLSDSTCKGFKCGGSMFFSGSVSSGIIYDADVERVVQQFGQSMQRVSLLAPAEELRTAMQANYAPYVVPVLIETWIENLQDAPGRQTSSPWPDRIQIGSMEGDSGDFVVNGTVVEVANSEGGEQIVGTYPVKLRLEKRGDSWLITSFEKGVYSTIPARTTITGTYTCLPHRDTSGPQTMECAFGIREESSGDHYSLNTTLLASTDWMNMPTGARIRVEGVMTPAEMLSSDQWQKYDIVGIISATSIQRL